MKKILKYLLNYKKVISSTLLFDNLYNRRRSRDEQDKYVTELLEQQISCRCNISAIYRVKNGESYIELSILSIASFVREIIVVDNGSTDRTVDIVNKLKEKLKGVVEIKLYSFNKKVCIAGDGYLNRVKSTSDISLSDFYNYCFSLGKGDYLMKVDAHYIFLPNELARIHGFMKSNDIDYITYRGVELFGKDLSKEAFIFKRKIGWSFVDGERYELLKIKDSTKLKSKTFNSPVYIHAKRLSYVSLLNSNSIGVHALYESK